MEEDLISKIKDLPKNWLFWLVVITGFAIFIRSLPAWLNPLWGGDFGIYYGITNSFIDTRSFYNPYLGWGESYQYFPVLYVVTGIAHWVTGLDVIVIMPKLIPIFGGVSVGIFYFVAYEILNNKKNAMLAAAFFAVMPFHVIQTSHAAPLTMGHFFMMLSLYFFIKFRKSQKYLLPLLFSTIFLILSHHLTTYMYLIVIFFVIISENSISKTWRKSAKNDTSYFLLATVFTFSYWKFFATPVFNQFMKGGLNLGFGALGPGFIIILFYAAVVSMFFLITIKRRLDIFPKSREVSIRASRILFASTVIIFISMMILFSFVDAPILDHTFSVSAVMYSIPVILVFGFTVVGIPRIKMTRNGAFVRGWMLALTISFLFAFITNNKIEHFRHFEYMMAPISIITVLGISRLLKDHHFSFLWSHSFKFSDYKIIVYKKLIYVAFIALIITANATTVYPGHSSMNMGYKSFSEDNLSVAEWIDGNISKNGTLFASDHRTERMLEALGYNTTKNKASLIWTEDGLCNYTEHLHNESYNYTVTHVVIDDVMKNLYVQKQYKKTVFDFMTNESYEKFSREPFKLLYRNETIDEKGQVIHWAEVYEVNWDYINKSNCKK